LVPGKTLHGRPDLPLLMVTTRLTRSSRVVTLRSPAHWPSALSCGTEAPQGDGATGGLLRERGVGLGPAPVKVFLGDV
jgi:hypothetical protein